jgi:predicted transcriptional regulator
MGEKSDAKENHKNIIHNNKHKINSESSKKIGKIELTKHTKTLKAKKLIQSTDKSKINKIVAKKTRKENFEPSMKIIHRIIKCLIKNEAETKTNLSRNANLNYIRLVKHIEWLEKKGLVKSIIKNSKINVMLTEKGRIFAITITKNEK